MKTDIEILLSFVPRMLSRRLKKPGEGPAGPSEDVQPAVLLFVDVSGFTALSERLADLGAIGSERLTEYLNTYFARIIELTAQHGGDVLKLAGDAMLVAWPIGNGDAVSQHLRAMECARGIQTSCHRYEVAPDEYLSVRIGLATGPLRTLIVGGKLGRWEFLPVCPLVQEVGQAQAAARPGQIVVTAGFREALGEAFDGEPIGAGLWRLTGPGGLPQPVDRRTEEAGDELIQPLKGFIPGAVLGRLADGSESWLAELRRVSAVFIYVYPDGGSSCSELALEVIQGLTEGIQEAIYRFEGSINKWSVDEKGVCLLAVFGLPPLSHEDDPLRAVRAAEEVAAFLESRGESCRIGVASGRVYCGLVGSRVRQEYTIIGFAVNRAARLAQAASGGILCDLSTKRQSEGHVSFDVRPPIEVKGIKDPLAVFSPVRGVPEWDETGAVTGHVKEMEQLQMGIQYLRRGQTLVYVIEGEAGIGKSTFLHRWGRHAQASGLTVVTGGGDSLHRLTPYYAWKLLLTDLFRKLGATTPHESGALIERLLDQENHSRLLAPLLNDILPAGLKDNHVSAQIVGGLRADNIRNLVVALITACAKERPLAVVIEDLHWCDSLSLRLTQAVAEKSVPLLMVAAIRPSEADDGIRAFYEGVPAAQIIRLGKFTAPECAALICAKLGALSVERPVTDFIFSRSGGSPLFATELAYALCESRRVCVEGGVCCVVPGVTLQHDEVPDSVQGVITQRVDRLDTPSQVAVKVASVIGEAFPTGVLKAVYPLRQDVEHVDLHLSQLEKCDLIRGQGEVPSTFRFSHALVHHTVYGLILYSQRKSLHSRIAHHLEQREDTGGKHTAALLGYHWKEGGELRRAAHHLGVAGEHAVREGAYQDALKILNQALEIGADQFPDGTGDTNQRLQQGHWHRMKAEALLGLGQLLASAGELVIAADLLGCPVPSTVDVDAVVTALQRRTREAGRTEADRVTGTDRTRILELVFCYEVLSILNLFSDNRIACLGAAFQTLAHAERIGDGPDLARALATVSLALSVQPERGMADWYAAAALRMSDRLGQEFTSSRVLELLGMQYLGSGQWDKAEAAFQKAIDGFNLVGDHRRRIECTCLYSTFQHYRGNFGRRVVMGMEVLGLAEISGDLQAGAWGYLDQLESLIAVGEFKAAQAIGEKLAAMIGSSIIGCDVIMTHGLLARLELRRGDSAAAVDAAHRALDVIRESDPTIVYNLEAYAAPAEVFVTMWQRELRKTVPNAAAVETWKTLAAGACVQLRRFARIFRIAAPRYFLWRGLSHHLAGRPGPGLRHLRRSTIIARRLEMPYEEALAAMHHSFLLPVENPEGAALAARSKELFASLSAEYDLACMEAGAW